MLARVMDVENSVRWRKLEVVSDDFQASASVDNAFLLVLYLVVLNVV